MYVGNGLLDEVMSIEYEILNYLMNDIGIPEDICNTMNDLNAMLEVEDMLHEDSLMNFVCDLNIENQ